MDGPIDDRDAGVLETAKGTILITTFTSLAYEPILTKAEQGRQVAGRSLARLAGGPLAASARTSARPHSASG